MNTERVHEKYLSENRFSKLFLTLRLAGTPLNSRQISRIQSVYNVITTISYYITYSSGLMDFLVNTNDLKDLMKNSRVLFGLTVVLWQHFFLR
jgi:hypothetical protein